MQKAHGELAMCVAAESGDISLQDDIRKNAATSTK
jgi:hypothetical protein